MSNCLRSYEQHFAGHLGRGRGFAFWKGRVALFAALKAIGIGHGDEVILPGYTCVMDVNPIKCLGAKPVYVDIEPATFNMDVALLEEKVTPRTKVIIAQHTYGYPCQMDRIMEVAAAHGIDVVEDCCLALGSTYRGRLCGTFGKASYFSFQWNKPYTSGLGGMVVTSDDALAAQTKQLASRELCRPKSSEVAMLWAQLVVYRLLVFPRTTALAQRVFRYLTKKGAVVGSSSTREYAPTMATDFFKGMSAVQARAGLRQLGKLEQNLAHRRQMAQLYDDLLERAGWLPRQYERDVMDPVMVRYPVRITEKDRAVAESAKAGIELGSWFECPLHPIETPLATYDYHDGMCPQAEKASREVVNLPVHPRVSESTVRKTVQFITRFTQAE